MGVDSGLPDFRGNEGFWKAYPPLARLGFSFADIANPAWFDADPALAWGFYGHRLNLYRDTAPHHGFTILREWTEKKRFGAFAFTSNVDGHFQKAGFAHNRIAECHGSLHHLQCRIYSCSRNVWSAEDVNLTVDPETLRAEAPLPRCRHCAQVARPNVLMFGDWHWNHKRSDGQEQHLEEWLGTVIDGDGKLAIVEIGAGRAIPTVRHLSEKVADATGGTFIRINPRDYELPRGKGIAIPLGGLDALTRIVAAMP